MFKSFTLKLLQFRSTVAFFYIFPVLLKCLFTQVKAMVASMPSLPPSKRARECSISSAEVFSFL